MSNQSVGAINSVTALINRVFQQPKGDFADRLNSRVTVCLLSLSAALMLSGHFMGDPITCWTPAQFTKQWNDFVNQYCYVHGTYFVQLDQQVDFEDDERRKQTIGYYQWVPYILAIQALLFYLPRFIWKALVSYSGYDLAGAIRYVDKYWTKVKDDDASFKGLYYFFQKGRPSPYIWDGLRLARKKKSRDMALYYTVSTLIQAVNAWCQWLWLNSLLNSPHYTFWGPSLVSDLIQGNDWQRTGHFPRVVHCDFQRRRPASVQLDTVLCVLGLNIYYEKLFIFLWFWFLFVAVVSSWNCVRWLSRLCLRNSARAVIDNYLKSQPDTSKISKEQFFRALGSDGLFVLQQMSENLGDMPTSYLTIAMRNQAESMKVEESDDDEEKRPFKNSAKFV